MYPYRLQHFPSARPPQPTVGGCATSHSNGPQAAAFHQASELARVGDLREGCMVFCAAWLDRIKRFNGNPQTRMDHLRQIDVLQNIETLQHRYRDWEIGHPRTEFDQLFESTFAHFDLALENRGYMDVMSDEQGALARLADHLRETGTSHVMVLVRMNGDHHAIALHEEEGRVHLFDPNRGESSMRSQNDRVRDALRELIQAYSRQTPLPEVHLLQVR